MARRDEAWRLLRDGNAPIEIAEAMGVRMTTVVPYLWQAVGRTRLFRIQILFAIPPDRRKLYDVVLKRVANGENLDHARRQHRLDYDDQLECEVYQICRESMAEDMYLLLRRLEIQLHQMVREVLEGKYPQHDDQWWIEGVPEPIRKDCAQRREEDPRRLEPFAYTTLLHLKEIVDKKWAIFKTALPTKISQDKRELMDKFDRLNRIRNDIMHPVKLLTPNEDDFSFVIGLFEILNQVQDAESQA